MSNRAQRRVGYLALKSAAIGTGCIGAVLFIAFGLLTLGCFIATLAGVFVGPSLTVFPCLIATALAGAITYLGAYMMIRANDRVIALPVVPAVREQIAALPAEEVLLRGAETPVATPDELLRAAREATASAPHELVRPVEGESA
jgi:hypothetical protein